MHVYSGSNNSIKFIEQVSQGLDILVGNGNLAPAVQRTYGIASSKMVLSNHPLEHLMKGNYTHVPVLLSVTRDVGAYIIDMCKLNGIHIIFSNKKKISLIEKLCKHRT